MKSVWCTDASFGRSATIAATISSSSGRNSATTVGHARALHACLWRGAYENGVEIPRAKVTLATGIPEDVCREINLGFRDWKSIRVEDYANREEEGVLPVPKAGEQLYRSGAEARMPPRANCTIRLPGGWLPGDASRMQQTMRVGIIGGGLMGREAASAFGRWFVLDKFPVRAELVAVCDLQDTLLDWFRQVPTVKLLTKSHHELLASADVDVVRGRPAQSPSGDLSRRIARGEGSPGGKSRLVSTSPPRGNDPGRRDGVRPVCPVQFRVPVSPGAQRVIGRWRNPGSSGICSRSGPASARERSGSHEAGELEAPGEVLRRDRRDGRPGHACGPRAAAPGWQPSRVYAQLQKVYTERPDGKREAWLRATLGTMRWCTATCRWTDDVPMRLEMKRLARGRPTPGGWRCWEPMAVRYSTAEPSRSGCSNGRRSVGPR